MCWRLYKMLESGDERRKMTSVICDNCGKVIPFVKKKNLLGIEEDVLDRGYVRCAEWRIDQLFYNFDLCKYCATMLSIQGDNLFFRLRLAITQEMKEE